MFSPTPCSESGHLGLDQLVDGRWYGRALERELGFPKAPGQEDDGQEKRPRNRNESFWSTGLHLLTRVGLKLGTSAETRGDQFVCRLWDLPPQRHSWSGLSIPVGRMNPRGARSSCTGGNGFLIARNAPAPAPAPVAPAAPAARGGVSGSAAPKQGFREEKRCFHLRISAAQEAPSCWLGQLSEAPRKQSWSATVFPRREILLAVVGEVLTSGFWQQGKTVIFADFCRNQVCEMLSLVGKLLCQLCKQIGLRW